MTPERADERKAERRLRLRRGAIGELAAAALLIAKGYRILARRHRTPFGEIDIIAIRRGWLHPRGFMARRADPPNGLDHRRLAFVEVKRRATREEAEAAVRDLQAARIARAAEHWMARHPRYQQCEMGLDAILVVPGRLPQHLPNALADF